MKLKASSNPGFWDGVKFDVPQIGDVAVLVVVVILLALLLVLYRIAFHWALVF